MLSTSELAFGRDGSIMCDISSEDTGNLMASIQLIGPDGSVLRTVNGTMLRWEVCGMCGIHECMVWGVRCTCKKWYSYIVKENVLLYWLYRANTIIALLHDVYINLYYSFEFMPFETSDTGEYECAATVSSTDFPTLPPQPIARSIDISLPSECMS